MLGVGEPSIYNGENNLAEPAIKVYSKDY